MRSRVMPGSSVTMERRVPVRRLNNVDLLTLGRPAMTINGNCDCSGIWIHESRIACEGGLHPHYFSMSAAKGRARHSLRVLADKKRLRIYARGLGDIWILSS